MGAPIPPIPPMQLMQLIDPDLLAVYAATIEEAIRNIDLELADLRSLAVSLRTREAMG